MRIFLAGASGAIGRELVPLLVGAGHDVVGTARSGPGTDLLRRQGARPVALDVFDAAAVRAAVAEAAPDVVVHQLTALSGGSLADNAAVRVTGTRNLVDAAAAAGVRRIVAQSISWAYRPGSGPAAETEPLDVEAAEPRAGTVAGVRSLEEAVAGIPEHVVLRYGLLYGPGTWYMPGGASAERIRSGELPPTTGVSSFVHVRDAARAALLALSWPSGAVNVVDDEPAPGTEWMPALAAALGAPGVVTGPVRDGAGWERGADNTVARTALGWVPEFGSWRAGFASFARDGA